MYERITKYRRDLHKIPELELELPLTYQYLLKQLKPLSCSISSPIPYSVAAYFDAGKEKTIAFRSDMDGLPVKEATDHDFKSRREDCMHACGHDGHMAILLEFAQQLNEIYASLPYNVLLIFQPGEESPGGARLICETKILEEKKVAAIFGTHLWPMLPKGEVATRKNEMMARSSEVNVDIEGKSSHVAKYKEGIDAMEISARYLLKCYEMEKSYHPDIYRLLRFGKLESGTVRNVVARKARMEGTLRAFQDEIYWELRKNMHRIAEYLERKYQAKIDLEFSLGYPAVINDGTLVEKVCAIDPQIKLLKEPEMISEDFAYYQQEVPGVFFFLGTGTGIPLHNAHFDFEESILEEGVKLYLKILKSIKL
ncbi:M20 metallopeptidase family protein [Dubosiella newyorkensis]|uniref:M20 metallopeptidase family protein n=1 Tax=Dubosiella newyorkensis TaxID=1862672 RepID=UPI00258EA901|nr:M20 family metallopeptidase [Dubosiella newyorkensis]